MNIPENTEAARQYQSQIDNPPVLNPITWADVAAAARCREMLDQMEQMNQPACSELAPRPGIEILPGRAETNGGDA